MSSRHGTPGLHPQPCTNNCKFRPSPTTYQSVDRLKEFKNFMCVLGGGGLPMSLWTTSLQSPRQPEEDIVSLESDIGDGCSARAATVLGHRVLSSVL